ncbi:MAG: hypothetical protein HZC37_26470 [Burkholderiales bacterium]|nr:hypothetical protein [Burkholderiales bacterium]
MAADKPAADKDADPLGAASDGSPELRALHEALAQLLAPVARLAVARGLPYAAAQEMLKRAFVEAASAAHPGLAEHRKVSRIATTTGINRREVTRLTAPAPQRGGPAAPRRPPRSAAGEVYAHWRTHPGWRDVAGQPRVLPRLGPAPSFEALAQDITRDVHPRSLLDELCRLGLARLDEAADTVALQGDAFVPSGDRVRMLGFLGENVGDHLRAAVDNVLASGRPPHLEQALFAEGLSAASLEALRPLLREQWAALRQALVPALEARIAADAAADAADPAAQGPRSRVRLGLYAYQEVPGTPQAPGDPNAPRGPVRARRSSARRQGPAAKDPKK